MNKYIGVKLIDAEPAICCNKNFFKSFAVEKLRIKFGKFLVLYCSGELMVLKRNK